MEDESIALLRSLLPAEWIVRRVEKDYGVDLEIEIVDESEVSGNRIWLQMKSALTVRRLSGVQIDRTFAPDGFATGDELSRPISYPLETRELMYAVRCPFPLLLVLADLRAMKAYWLPIRDEIETNLDRRQPNWRGQKTASVRIPAWNEIGRERENGYPGLRWFAREPARIYVYWKLFLRIREFHARYSLSGYGIGDGWIDGGEGPWAAESLRNARLLLTDALDLDILFGPRPRPASPASEYPATIVLASVQDAISAVDEASALLEQGAYRWIEMAKLLADVGSGLSRLEAAVSMHSEARARYLLTAAND